MQLDRRELLKTSIVLPFQRMLPPTEYQSAQADGMKRQPFLRHTKDKYNMFFMAIDGQRQPGPLMLIGHHAKYYDTFRRLNESRARGPYDAMLIDGIIGDMKTEPRTPNLVFEKKTGKSRRVGVAEAKQPRPSVVLI